MKTRRTWTRGAGMAGFRRLYIDAWEMPQVLEFVSINRREIYINIGAAPGANVVRLAFNDRDLFRVERSRR